MYDDLADVYDRFIDWPTRLSRELPLLGQWLADARRVADVACGTGRHAAALAEAGYEVVGYDASAEALARADDSRACFHQASFGRCSACGEAPFDAVLCLGNSLPHVLTLRDLRATLSDFQRLLRPGGRLLAHLRNLPRARARDERWLPLREHTDADGTQWLFQRIYDYLPRSLVRFQFVILRCPPGGHWAQQVESTTLREWPVETLTELFGGWSECALLGSLQGEPFDPERSADLWLSARR